MTLFRIAILWRIPLAVLLGAAFLGVAAVAGDLSLHLPMTDGPRKARQALLLTLPLVLSTLLLPPLSDVHGSLPRQRLHHWATLIVFWSVTIAVCTGAWMGSGIARNVIAFEMLSTFAMTAAALFLVPRFGVRVIVGLTITGCAWLLYGTPLGGALGFGDLADDTGPFGAQVSSRGWLLVAASLAACAVASLPTRPGTQAS